MASTYFSAEQVAESIFSVEEVSAEVVAPIQLPRPNSTCNDENETPVGLHQFSESEDGDDKAGGITSIHSALDANNYKLLSPATNHKHYTAVLEKAKTKKKNQEITWSNIQQCSTGRQPRSDVLPNNPVVGVATDADTARKAWELFFSKDMIKIVLERTNKRIRKVRSLCPVHIFDDDRYTYLEESNETELLSFIGLVYFHGAWGLNMHTVDELFSKRSVPDFGATMSKNRFRFLNTCITFDDTSSRQTRWKRDRFAAFHTIFEIFNSNCSTHLIPHGYLSLDETLYPTRTKVSFKQYNPSKPAKYGTLFKSLNAIRYAYTYCILPYCGKPIADSMPYYVAGIKESVKYLVQKLQGFSDLQGQNITFDRLYTSVPLAMWLLEQNITCVGTLQSNRSGIPDAIKQTNGGEPFSYKYFWESEKGRLALHLYVVKTESTGLRNVLLLSTVQPILGISKNPKKQPAIYKLYDYTKGGTDITDQRMGTYSCHTKSRRWTLAALPCFGYLSS